jgi:hypothetical protein
MNKILGNYFRKAFMSESESKKSAEMSKEEKLLKDIVIESFTKWSTERPSSRTVQASGERLPTISTSTFGRILDASKPRGATLDEAIEILTMTNQLELLNRYMTQSNSDGANYLRMLKNNKGEQVKVDFSSTDPIALMNAINDGFAQTKVELKKKEIIIERALGMFIGAIICGFLIFYFQNFHTVEKFSAWLNK